MKPNPCTLVIFGASGDLTKRKLIPALHNLSRDDLLPDNFALVGFSRAEFNHESYRAQMSRDIETFATPGPVDRKHWDKFAANLFYLTNDYDDESAYHRLKELLDQLDRDNGTSGNRIFYCATPASAFPGIVDHLGRAGLHKGIGEGCVSRIIVEKPFGRDLESARSLNEQISRYFREDQVYRIDHYTGKETVQNLVVFRFANCIFEPIWNRRYVDNIQITAAESIGVEGRGASYEEAGALRDVMQNHVIQLLALIAMEPPISLSADAIRDEKVKVLHAIRPMTEEDVLQRSVRGQYGPGAIKDKQVAGYRHEPSVNPESQTETYAAMKLLVDNWRWADVPFYLRTGKRLPRRVTEVTIQFRNPPLALFRETAVSHIEPNRLLLNIQPEEGIGLRFEAKVPGTELNLQPVEMDFTYGEAFGSQLNTGYETLLYDAMTGDSTLFSRRDLVEASWQIVTPILNVWHAIPQRDFPNYAAGTWGPVKADELLQRDGREWSVP